MIKKVVILAGGLGTRLKPLTDNMPKPMIPIKKKPILEHIIMNLKKYGIDDITIVLYYKPKSVIEYFGDGKKFDVKINYIVLKKDLGTGGAIKKSITDNDKPFFLVWGDNLMNVNWKEIYKKYQRSKAKVVMALTIREDVEHFGVAKLKNSKIIYFVEKPKRKDAPSKLINAGAFIVNPDIFRNIKNIKFSFERDVLEDLTKKGEVFSYIHKGQWFPIDTISKYKIANKEFFVK